MTNLKTQIAIQTTVNIPFEEAWKFYTLPEHITGWNFAHPSWHCPSASNDLQVGGKYHARMEARDGSFGFDFVGVYSLIEPYSQLTYTLEDGRTVNIRFNQIGDATTIEILFDPENENPIELQRDGWQAILNNYRAYAESN